MIPHEILVPSTTFGNSTPPQTCGPGRPVVPPFPAPAIPACPVSTAVSERRQLPISQWAEISASVGPIRAATSGSSAAEAATPAGTQGLLNDLWKFNPSTGQWTWIAGSSTVAYTASGHEGIYGTQGVASAGNVPDGRWTSFSWTDKSVTSGFSVARDTMPSALAAISTIFGSSIRPRASGPGSSGSSTIGSANCFSARRRVRSVQRLRHTRPRLPNAPTIERSRSQTN
jgi:hypothetical protein